MTVLGLYNNVLQVPPNAHAGIDISGHNSPSVIDATAPYIEWVSIKATEGASFFDYNDTSVRIERAQANGLRWGLYHFARPDVRVSPNAEVDFFLSAHEAMVARHGRPTMRCMLDVETSATPLSPQYFVENWLSQVHTELMYAPFWYTYTYWMRSYLNPYTLATYPLWLADYTRSTPNLPSDVLDMVAIHQFTSSTSLWGSLDLNVTLKPHLISPSNDTPAPPAIEYPRVNPDVDYTNSANTEDEMTRVSPSMVRPDILDFTWAPEGALLHICAADDASDGREVMIVAGNGTMVENPARLGMATASYRLRGAGRVSVVLNGAKVLAEITY